MKTKKTYLVLGLFSILLIAVFFPNIAYAATSAEIKFCDYAGVRRTFKICGVILNIVKIVVPLIIIIMGMMDCFKAVTSGKSEDITGGLMKLAKRIFAGLVIFFIPLVLDVAFDELVGYDDTGFTTCTNCLLDTDNCTIPDKDPDTYIE